VWSVKNLFNKVLLNLTNYHRLSKNVDSLFQIHFLAKFRMILLTLNLYQKYRKLKVPFRQMLILDSALKVQSALEKSNIDFVILGGSLLGAVRQGAFAGRPGDFDIGIKETDINGLLSLEKNYLDSGLSLFNMEILHPTNPVRYGSVVIMPKKLKNVMAIGCQVQIHIHEFRDGSWRWRRWSRDLNINHPARLVSVHFPQAKGLFYASIFGFKFPIPTNYEEYLIQSYGQRWRTPESKQFSWRNPEITRS
jgi:hypothetical protein